MAKTFKSIKKQNPLDVVSWQVVYPTMVAILVTGLIGVSQPQPYVRCHHANGSTSVRPYQRLHLM